MDKFIPNNEASSRTGLEIAVIGIAERFPGARHIDEFWENLKKGIESVSFFSEKELEESGIDLELLNNPGYVKAKGLLDDMEYFDAGFFDYTDREAEIMDPQSRILHEICWEALENAAYNPFSYKGLIGVYAGASQNYFWLAQFLSRLQGLTGSELAELGTLNNNNSFCTRISYKMNLNGPSVFVQTACSTSLVAIHLAYQSILAGECDMALAGGISISIPKKSGYLYQEGMLLSKKGHVNTFDANGDGTVFGNGAGIVVLKLLEEAIADRDTIHALIKGSAINNDGYQRTGFTAPGTKGQAAVIRRAMQAAEVEPESISYIEAHGTGTKLGDPIEIQALKEAFNTNKKNFCAIGSVKTNLGHLDAAAGVTGLMKTILALKHKVIPPMINFDTPNPEIDFIDSPFYINRRLTKWENGDYPLRAGISSFGFGGTNAHVILEEAPIVQNAERKVHGAWSQGRGWVSPPSNDRDYQLIVLSAKTESALDRMTQNLTDHLKKNPSLNLADLAYTLQVGRKAFQYRKMFVCPGIDEAIKILTGGDPSKIQMGVVKKKDGNNSCEDIPAELSGLFKDFQEDESNRNRLLEKIGALWLRGHPIDWLKFQSTEKRQRIPLPIYPFERQRYWHEGTPVKMDESVRQALPVHGVGGNLPYPGACWLIFMEEPGFNSLWQERLQNLGASVFQVEPGTRFERIDDVTYFIPRVIISPVNPGNLDLQPSRLHEPPAPSHKGQRPELSSDFAAPTDEVEKIIAGIWQEFLGIDQVGIYDDFLELGANSLSIITIATKIHEAMDVIVPMDLFFSESNIKGIGEYIRNAERNIHYSIEPSEEKEYYLLSSAQRRIYIIQQMDLESTAYNITQVMELEGKIIKEDIEWIFRKLIRRHESLRTSFEMIEVGPVQKINENAAFAIEYHDITGAHIEDQADLEVKVEDIITGFIRPFDLSQTPLFRVGLIHIPACGQSSQQANSGHKHILVVDIHHIISDGASLGVLLREFLSFYGGKELPERKIQYKDISTLQNSRKVKESLKQQEKYWMEEFTGQLPALDIPIDYLRPSRQNFEGKKIDFTLAEEKTDALKVLTLKEETTLYMVLISIYYILLYKLSDQEDIIIGAPTAGRRHADIQETIGMFLNILALRNYPQDRKFFRAFLKEVKAKVLEAFENQEYQFEDLVDQLELKRDTSRHPLFDVMFLLQNLEVPEMEIPGLRLNPLNFENSTTIFDLSLYAKERDRQLVFTVEYCAKLFKPESIKIFIRYFQNIMSAVLQDPAVNISDIRLMDEETQNNILTRLNESLEDEVISFMTSGETIQHRLNKYSYKSKDLAAIDYGDITLTYGELDARSDYIVNKFLKDGIKRETFIGILLENRLELIMVILGIIKAGCVFIPLDPSYPDSRLELMIDGADIELIITGEANLNHLAQNKVIKKKQVKFLSMDHLSEEANQNTQWFMKKPVVQYLPEDKIYTYFTSGTTGTPKAIIGKNRSLLHFIAWEINRFGLISGCRFSQLISPSFDPYLRDIFVPLCVGGVSCIPVDKKVMLDPRGLTDWLETSRIQFIHCVPGLFRLMTSRSMTKNSYRHLEFVLLSGEKINPSDLVEWYETVVDRVQLVNIYGPTESTLAKIHHLIRKDDVKQIRIPIGKPIAGSRVVILDKESNICAPLVKGEICIRTPFMSHGYYNDPELNKKKFISNPFSHVPGDILYRSGDWGRVLADGNIDILGRIDRQVKIRGHRIELEEIENVITTHPRVKEVAVVKWELSNHNEVLCAYVEEIDNFANLPQKVDNISFFSHLTEFLAKKVPDFMIPSTIIKMEKIPRTPNGKVDYRRLPHPLQDKKKPYLTFTDEIEKRLLELWVEILGIEKEKITATSGFFQLGGSSLNVMTLIARIHQIFDTKITLGQIFNNLSIKKQAEIIKNAGKERHRTIQPQEKKEYYTLSSAQKRLYYLQQMIPASTAYNMSNIVRLESQLEMNRLEWSFRQLVLRHESFRTSFRVVNDEPVQQIHAYGNLESAIEYFYLEHRSPGLESEKIIRDFIRPFDVSTAPLLRVGLINAKTGNDLLMVDMHHIISDGISMGILVKEFVTLYGGNQLSPLSIQYKDYSEWHNTHKEKPKIKKQGDYWLKQFSGKTPVLNLPTDYVRLPQQSFEGNALTFEIGEKETSALKKLALDNGTTLFVVLVTAYNILMAKLSGQEDLIIGTPIAGRSHADLEHIIGMFVNTLPLRNYPEAGKTFLEFLGEVAQSTLKSYENQDYQFEDLVETVVENKDFSRNPLFDVMLIFQNMDMPEIEDGILKISSYKYNKKTAKFDLKLEGHESNEKLFFELEYCTRLFNEERIDLYIAYFKNILSSILDEPHKKISEIKIAHEEDIEGLLYQFHDDLRKESSP